MTHLDCRYGLQSVTGSSGIVGLGAVNASHILINILGHSGANLGVVADINTNLNGTIILPYDTATFHSESGAIWGGNNMITLMSGATITNVPFQPPSQVPDAGATVLLMGLGLAFLAGAKRKFRL